jgi:hypothetical protein
VRWAGAARAAIAGTTVAALLAMLGATAATARADGFARLPEGAPMYAAVRPLALVGAMQKLGVSELPEVQKLKQQLGGIDPFNPLVLSGPGLDVAAPLVASVAEPLPGNVMHTRVVATLRDKGLFAAFVQGLIASGQVKLIKAPSSIKDAVAVSGPGNGDVSVLIRVFGDEVVLDEVETNGKKPMALAEVARRFPAAPAHALALGHGARRLFAPDATAVVYVDGRRMGPMLTKMALDDAERDLKEAAPEDKAKMRAKLRAQTTRCAIWQKAPGLFDDVGLALTATPDSLTLSWAWGTASGPPLGGLKLAASDDAALDAGGLARDAVAVVALYAATLSPFAALKRSGMFATSESLNQAVDGCETMAGAHLVLRSWPLAIGALMTTAAPAGSPLGAVKQTVDTLRNVVVAMRTFPAQNVPAHFAVAATFDNSARPTLEMLLAGIGATGSPTTFGKRSPTVYPFKIPGTPSSAVAALEGLAGSRLGVTFADSDESLAWAFKSVAAAVAPAPLPLLRLEADTVQIAKLAAGLGAGKEQQPLLDLIAKLRHVDGALTSDGDLLRLSLHAPLRP